MLSLYFDEELEADAWAEVRGHVAECTSCQAVLRDFQVLRRALAQTTPAPSPRHFSLTEADIAGARPDNRLAEPAAASPARRVSILTLPFVPALTAVAALLLIAVIAGEVLTRENSSSTQGGTNREIVMPDGSVITPTSQDLEPNVAPASENDMNRGDENGNAQSRSGGDVSFWSWWRIGEALLAAILVGLLATWLIQRRAQRR
jgi:anti-sigma factor RsiW